MKKLIVLISIALISLATGMMARNGWSFLENKSQPLPPFSLSDLSGKTHDIAEWRGKVLVINFWATWCPPCKKEIPEFMAVQKQYSSQGLQFIGVAIDDKEAVKEYLSQAPINYPVLIAEEEGLALAYKMGDISGTVPFTVVVSKEGQILHRHPGNFSKEQILEIVGPLLINSQSNQSAN
jgi:thiol-disulfide isomerase/thioredoxin